MSKNQNALINNILSRYVGFIPDVANDALHDVILTIDLVSYLSGVAIDTPGSDIISGQQMKAVLRVLLRELEKIKADIYYLESPLSLRDAQMAGIARNNK